MTTSIEGVHSQLSQPVNQRASQAFTDVVDALTHLLAEELLGTLWSCEWLLLPETG